MTDLGPKIARAAIFEIIENQMRDHAPPEAKETYDRLIADGHSREQTMKMIGCVVTCEICDVIDQNQPFNQERYVAALQSLPELPWENDDG